MFIKGEQRRTEDGVMLLSEKTADHGLVGIPLHPLAVS
jgi:hypothetical protein